MFTRRAAMQACLLATLALGSFAPAQTRQPKPSEEPRAAKEIEREPELAAEQMRMEREMDREMLRIREAMMRDALNRMRFGGGRNADREILNYLIPFLVFLAILLSLLWVLRVLLENRRWSRAAMVQSETHKRLLEKFASGQELLAYMESEAGRRFLESTPIQIEHAASAPSPYGRILWSVHVGLILATTGAGLLALQGRVPEGTVAFLVFGTLALAMGAGFLFSAIASYILSKSFGLFEAASRPAGVRTDFPTGPQ